MTGFESFTRTFLKSGYIRIYHSAVNEHEGETPIDATVRVLQQYATILMGYVYARNRHVQLWLKAGRAVTPLDDAKFQTS